MLADPTDASSARFVKISNSSGADLDLTGWYLLRWTNGNAGALQLLPIRPRCLRYPLRHGLHLRRQFRVGI